jgi:hypothetical protein
VDAIAARHSADAGSPAADREVELRRIFLAWPLLMTLATAAQAQSNSFVTIASEPTFYAWWLRAQFHPFETQVRGIPVGRLRAGWCKATEFRKDLIPRELVVDERGVDAMQAAEMSFAMEGRFDGSATTQVALVGVYQECSGKKGRFILILDQPGDGKAKIRFVNAIQTDHQFGALQKGKDNTIVAWSCMECDGSSVLKWDRKKRKFDWLPEPDEE